jgi:predicted Zn-dependent peptidase
MSVEMQFHSTRLSNGLTIIGETSASARSVAIGFFVHTGSRDETPTESGVSHFLEHMMFKGTLRRTALDVNLDFDRIGASNNAYTSDENTVYYAAVLPEYLPKALDILADILRPSLRLDDFTTEKEVILEEIGMYDDQPGWVASDNARQIYYAQHPLGNSVLGTNESIKALTRDQMQAYFDRRYAANNIILSVAGNFEWEKLVELATASCSGWTSSTVGRENRTAWGGVGGLHVLTREKVQQEHVLFLSGGPPADSKLRYAADTLALAIGDDTGSRLYWGLVDPGLADSADCGYSDNDANGCVCVSYSCEPEQTEENLEVVREILSDIQRDSITEDELKLAKCKIASRVVRGSERPMGRMQQIASSWTYTGEYRDVSTEMANYDSVTLADIRAYLNKYPIDRTTIVSFGPLRSIEGVTGKTV